MSDTREWRGKSHYLALQYPAIFIAGDRVSCSGDNATSRFLVVSVSSSSPPIHPPGRLTCSKPRSALTNLSTYHVGNAQVTNRTSGAYAPCQIGPLDRPRMSFISFFGKHFDFHGLGLVVHSLLVCRGLNVIIVRSLGQPHLTARFAKHGRVGGPAHNRHNAHTQRLQLEPQDFRHACFGCFGTGVDTWPPG